MANIKSAKKRISVIAKKTLINKSHRSALKTTEKRVLEAITAGDMAVATEKYNTFVKKVAQAAANGTIHRNKAARKMSRLALKLNALK